MAEAPKRIYVFEELPKIVQELLINRMLDHHSEKDGELDYEPMSRKEAIEILGESEQYKFELAGNDEDGYQYEFYYGE